MINLLILTSIIFNNYNYLSTPYNINFKNNNFIYNITFIKGDQFNVVCDSFDNADIRNYTIKISNHVFITYDDNSYIENIINKCLQNMNPPMECIINECSLFHDSYTNKVFSFFDY